MNDKKEQTKKDYNSLKVKQMLKTAEKYMAYSKVKDLYELLFKEECGNSTTSAKKE